MGACCPLPWGTWLVQMACQMSPLLARFQAYFSFTVYAKSELVDLKVGLDCMLLGLFVGCFFVGVFVGVFS